MLPVGVIALWHGSIATIPGGWHLCDGTAGTPDLRDRFIVGAGSTYPPDASGGHLTHTHAFTSDGHFHTHVEGTGLESGFNFNLDTDIKTDTGTTDATNHLPPYYSLAFIMRI